MKKKLTKPEFTAFVISAAKKAAEAGISSFDVEDPVTRDYAAAKILQIKESVSSWDAVIKMNTEGVATSLASAVFESVRESAEVGDQALISRTAEDAVGISALVQAKGDKELLLAALDIREAVPDSAEAEKASDTKEAGKEEPVVDPVPVTADNAGTQVKESVPHIILSQEIDETPWEQVNQAAVKTRLREAKAAGSPGIDDIIREAYGSADVDEPATWKYLHHNINESGALCLNLAGLDIATKHMTTRWSGSQDALRLSAAAVSKHFAADAVPATLKHIAEAAPGVYMVSIEVQQGDKVVTLETADSETAQKISIAESVGNKLRESGALAVSGPVTLQIDQTQLDMVCTNLSQAAKILMGEYQPVEMIVQSIQDMVPSAEVDKIKESVILLTKKLDTLQSLMEGSPLAGIAESVVKADSLLTVDAYRKVAESVGVQRLITAGGGREKIKESAPKPAGLEGLGDMLDDSQEVQPENPAKDRRSKKDLAIYV